MKNLIDRKICLGKNAELGGRMKPGKYPRGVLVYMILPSGFYSNS
jgi:hypothetical protein